MNRQFHSLHFIGIKGVGMSALALVAKGMGYDVSGSDTAERFITDESLEQAGIQSLVGFSADHLAPTVDLVVVGAAYGQDNVEVVAAHQRNLPTWTYSETLAYLAGDQKTLAVAGTHGKTTTTSLLAYLMAEAGKDPSYVIGTGEIPGLPAHGAAGTGEYFVAEADDYKKSPTDSTPKFLDLAPFGAIITSIEHDHPDMYPTVRDCIEAFYNFAQRVSSAGFLVVNGDDQNIAKVRARIADRRFISYGVDHDNDYRIEIIGDTFQLHADKIYGPFELQLKGEHNTFNAAAAVVVALQVGVDEAAIKSILPTFRSVERRYQLVGEVNGVTIIDDYAHHPTAVRLTLETAKKQYPDRSLWCIFQSHTYSRTKALLKEFGTSFTAADYVIVTDIFASAREQEATIKTDDLVREIGHHHKNTLYVPMAKLVDFMKKNIPANSVVITMGAGDIYKVGRQYLEESK